MSLTLKQKAAPRSEIPLAFQMSGQRCTVGSQWITQGFIFKRCVGMWYRWLTDEGLSGLDKSFIPFGGGARKCMGYNFAMMEIKVRPVPDPCSTFSVCFGNSNAAKVCGLIEFRDSDSKCRLKEQYTRCDWGSCRECVCCCILAGLQSLLK